MIKVGKFLVDLRPVNSGLFAFEINLNKNIYEYIGTLETIDLDLKNSSIFSNETKENLLKAFNHLKKSL